MAHVPLLPYSTIPTAPMCQRTLNSTLGMPGVRETPEMPLV